MKLRRSSLATMALGSLALISAAKPKVVTLGRPLPVKWFLDADGNRSVDIKVRALLVNGDPKVFITGDPHEVTDTTFVVRQATRINDYLPTDEKPTPKWRWQPAGWIMVDRRSAHITRLPMPDFDPFYSEASWYRDYVAYCGISESGDKLEAIVAQIGRRKPVLKKSLGAATNGDTPDADCSAPTWEREPMRATFRPKSGEQVVYTVREHTVELEPDGGDTSDSDDTQTHPH